MINILMEKIRVFLNSEISEKDYDEFYNIETLAFKIYEEVSRVNPKLAQIINDDLIDICAEVSYQGNYLMYREELKKVYNDMKALIKK